MIDRKQLSNALGRRDVSDWVIVERQQEIACVDDVTHLRRVERRTRWLLTVHVDVYNGRGSAQLTIDAVDSTADTIVEQAVALARAAVGPGWTNHPPAAPAKVSLFDPMLAADDVLTAADRVSHETTRARITVTREAVATTARTGFRAQWFASMVRADALVIAHDRSLEISRIARRMKDLELAAGITSATTDLELLATAGAPTAGPCALVLAADAMLHDGLGVWTAFANQADAIVERQGLTRYHENAPVAPGADREREPLTVISDGALDFGVRSAPLGDEGDAVRTFPLVDKGISAGLGLSPREAALRKRDPNGGVRNLVVTSGSWSGAVEGRTIEVRRLRDLAIDPYTGEATLEIALGIDRATGKPFSGGTVRLDLISTLAHARRSVGRLRRGAYDGPSAVLIERAELIV